MNAIPNQIKKIYLMAICGTGMGALAGLLKERGYEVVGSDNNVYPPMSNELARLGITVHSPYSAENIAKEKPDLVIIGNALSKGHPEIEAVLQSQLAYVSMPQALNHFFLKDREVIVVAGTHGKTTTTALLSHILSELGLDPSWLVGGVSQGGARNVHIGRGRHFVIEGDEYDTAFFDKGPKFLHYNPRHTIITSVEFDHADIYRDTDHLIEAFSKLVDLTPPEGSLHYGESYPALEKVAESALAIKRRYGFDSPSWQISNYQESAKGVSFDISVGDHKRVSVNSPLPGRHNALNAAACLSVIDALGYDLEKAAAAITRFPGVKRRQEVLFDDGNFAVIDDFAHHPTAVRETIRSVRGKYPGRKITAVFEPRSNSSMRKVFQEAFGEALAEADSIVLAPIARPDKIAEDQALNVTELVSRLQTSGRDAAVEQTSDLIVKHVVERAPRPGVALVMSNGGFDGVPYKIAAALVQDKSGA